ALLAAHFLETHRSRAWKISVLLSGIFCGLAVLTRYAAIAAVPGVALFIALLFGRRRWGVTAAFCGIALLCVLPWMIRNQRISGTPFGLAPRTALHNSNLFAEDSVERALKPFPADESFVLPVFRALRSKLINRFNELYQRRLLGFGEGLLFPFFLASFFFRFIRRDVNLFRWCIGVSLFGVFLAATLFGESTFRLFHVFWPVMILYGLSFFFLLLDRLQIRLKVIRIAIASLVVLLSATPMILALLPPRTGVPYPPYFPPFIMSVSRMLEPQEAIATDMPWATAWYGNRASIYIPQSLDGFYEINDYYQRVSAIYFTTLTRDKPYVRELKTGPYRTWFPILEGRIPSDFPLVHGFPLNNLDQLFLADRPRWVDRP
ncbi:MAG: hypothetical protein U1E27_12195, partial [Kiritimatiellia bacterium]|nr:hypothetical protein [Kiritimatiellia bacterium]